MVGMDRARGRNRDGCPKGGDDKHTGAPGRSGYLQLQVLFGGSQPFRDINQVGLVQRRNRGEVGGNPEHCEGLAWSRWESSVNSEA